MRACVCLARTVSEVAGSHQCEYVVCASGAATEALRYALLLLYNEESHRQNKRP